MTGKYQIGNRGRNIVIGGMAALYVFISLHCILHTRTSINRPFPGFLMLRNNLVPVIYLPQWEGIQRGVKFGDIVLAVDGQPVSNSEQVRALVRSSRPGTPLTYTIRRGNREFRLTIPVPLFTLRDYLTITLIWMLMGTAYYLAGLTAFFLKPNNSASRAFLLAGTTGLSMVATPGYCIDNSNLFPLVFLTILGPTVLLLSLYFPVELKFKKPVIFLIVVTTVPLVVFYIHYVPQLSKFLIVDKIFLADLILGFALGSILMIRSFVISQDAVVRQRAKIVVYAFALTAVLGGFGLFASLVLKVLNFFWLFILFATFPLSVAYAIIKHNLFDVDVLIRRSAGYLIVSMFVIVVSFLLISGLSLSLEKITGQPSQVAAVITIFIMLVMVRPLHNRIDQALERRFFGEKYEYQKTLRRAAKILNSIIELEPLLKQILDMVMDSIKIQNGCILLRDKDRGSLKVAVLRDPSRGAQLHADNPEDQLPVEVLPNTDHLLKYLMETSGKSIQINDLERMLPPNPERGPMLEFMKNLKLVLLIPIYYEIRMTGILGLGPKNNGAWYSSEDIELLQTLMMQTAMSIENAHRVKELKKLVELKISNRELKKINELKDNFLSMVSHDLRTPMTGIKAYAEIMREQIGQIDEESQKKYLNIILQQSDRLTRLINDLLDIQRFEAGRMEMDLTDLGLRGLVNESVEAFMGLVREKNLKLEKKVPEREIIIRGNRDRMLQALANLLSNAIKFTPEQGRILVELEVALEDGAHLARISVSDTGPGIPAELQDKLFDKFSQLHNPSEKRLSGSGLGLALARQIVEFHGGRVGVKSEPGKGSNFYFLVPLAQEQK